MVCTYRGIYAYINRKWQQYCITLNNLYHYIYNVHITTAPTSAASVTVLCCICLGAGGIQEANHRYLPNVANWPGGKKCRETFLGVKSGILVKVKLESLTRHETSSTVWLRLCSDGSSVCYSNVTLILTFWPQNLTHSSLSHNTSLV